MFRTVTGQSLVGICAYCAHCLDIALFHKHCEAISRQYAKYAHMPIRDWSIAVLNINEKIQTNNNKWIYISSYCTSKWLSRLSSWVSEAMAFDVKGIGFVSQSEHQLWDAGTSSRRVRDRTKHGSDWISLLATIQLCLS